MPMRAEALKTYSLRTHGGLIVSDDGQTIRSAAVADPAQELVRRVNAYMVEHPTVATMQEAIKLLCLKDPATLELVRAYGRTTGPGHSNAARTYQIANGGLQPCAQCPTKNDCRAAGICSIGQRQRRSAAPPTNVSHTFAAKVDEFMRSSGEQNYAAASRAVARQHPQLAQQYAEWQSAKRN